MFVVMLYAKPSNIKRLRIIVMMGLRFTLAALFARSLDKPPVPDRVLYGCSRGFFVRVSFFPCLAESGHVRLCFLASGASFP